MTTILFDFFAKVIAKLKIISTKIEDNEEQVRIVSINPVIMYLQSLYCLRIYNFTNPCRISHGFHRTSLFLLYDLWI